jgi:hypothetical protein
MLFMLTRNLIGPATAAFRRGDELIESTENTRYVKVFVAEEDMFTVTFCDYRDEPLRYIPRSSYPKTNQTQIPQDELLRLGEVISGWVIDGVDAEGRFAEDLIGRTEEPSPLLEMGRITGRERSDPKPKTAAKNYLGNDSKITQID